MKKLISKHELYRRWTQIKYMITNENAPQHEYYANIERTGFDDFWEFVDLVETTIGPLPSPDHRLARLDQRAGYVRGNLFWASEHREVTQRFTGIAKFKIGRKSLTYREMAEQSGICEYTIRSRIDRGWTAKDAITIAPALGNRIYGPL